ncbi:MAG TPA: hypothetical protein VOA87_06690 [Thermoanaerobaculia bacterium]|nr:hypothetical protein [Thermoanaerobaculia bacterium]
MHSKVWAVSILLAIGINGVCTAQAPPPAPVVSVTFQGQTAIAQGMTPGGSVVWFSVSKEVSDYEATIVPRQSVVPADATGQATFELSRSLVRQSIWIAVDLATGAYAWSSPFPARFTPASFTLPAPGLTLQAGLAPDKLIDLSDYSELLLVRPGIGAWSGTAGRGGVNDESSPDDPGLKVSLDRLAALTAATPALSKAALHDLLFVVHPLPMELAVTRVEVLP